GSNISYFVVNPFDAELDRGIKTQITQPGVHTLDLFAPQGQTGPFTLIVDRAVIDPSVTPRVGTCEDATHRSLAALDPIAPAGQILLLCAGEHITVGGFDVPPGLELVGEGRELTSITGLSESSAFESSNELVRLEGLSWRVRGTTRFNVPRAASISFSDVAMVPAAGIHVMALELRGDSEGPGGVTIDGLEMSREGGITLRDIGVATMNDLFIDASESQALRSLDTVETLEVTNSTLFSPSEMNLPEVTGSAVFRNSRFAISTAGVVLRAVLDVNASLTVEDSELIGFGALGFDLTASGPGTAVTFARNRFTPTSETYQSAIILRQQAGTGVPDFERIGQVTLTNNIFAGFSREVFEVVGNQGLSSFYVAHNHLETSGLAVIALREPDGSTSQPWTIVNNVFVGDGSANWGVESTALALTNFTFGGNLFFNVVNPYPIAITHPNDLYDTDPQVVNYEPTMSSPTIDAGATFSGLPTIDIEGNARPQGMGVDIGPFER
ncbi:MAG: choice-of-anchor Q domain-containing protein, partial [Myxococcota bacterium]